jgi:hypothetical protein|tara:strand:- start:17908 stop:18387 length:480 start_codon:yes stop_codon:yes gene_type:complete
MILIFIGDRANEVNEALNLKSSDTEINQAIETIVQNGYKRYRLARVLSRADYYENVGIPIEVNTQTDQIVELTDQIAEWSVPIKKVAVIWDHYLYDSRAYAEWYGLSKDVSADVVQLAVNKCVEYETKMLVPKCEHVFKLSRLNDNDYISNFKLNMNIG